jgi:hypothetical protein
MKIFILFISLCFFLLTKQKISFAATHQNHFCYAWVKNDAQKLQQKIPLNNKTIIFLEETDLEEDLFNDVVKFKNQTNYFVQNYCNSTNCNLIALVYNHKILLPSPTILANLAPIYLKIRALKI